MSTEQPEQTNKVNPERKGLTDGVYLRGTVNGEPVIYTADTGASCTIISARMFKRIPEAIRPKLDHSTRVMGARGASIKGLGKAEFELTLGPLELRQNVLVAEIKDDALLGYDILRGSNGKSADILLSRNKIILDGIEIPLFQTGKEKQARRVVVADDASSPGKTEAVVDVLIERVEGDDHYNADYIVELTKSFKKSYPLRMASTLVKLNQGPTCKIRILNPFPYEVAIGQEAEIGRAERIDEIVSTLAETENAEKSYNFESAKRQHTVKAANDGIAGSQVKMAKEDSMPNSASFHRKHAKAKASDEAHFGFGTEDRPGRKMAHREALSRCPAPKDCACFVMDMNEPLEYGPCERGTWRAQTMTLQQQAPGGETAKPVKAETDAPMLVVGETFPIRATPELSSDKFAQGASRSKCPHGTICVGVCSKLEKRYDGPFVIKQKISELNFEIQMDRDGSTKVIHRNKLKKYERETPPKWASSVSKHIKRHSMF